MYLGYNTNGLAHHSLSAAIEVLAAIGYQSIAITLDHAALNPYGPQFETELCEISNSLADHNLSSTVETGARYLLDPRHKHQPTLLSSKGEGRPRRVEFLRHSIDIAAALHSDCVSLWSGSLPADVASADGMARLAESLHPVLDYAGRHGVCLGFEPEPGMLVDTMASYAELISLIDSPFMKLTLDVGHVHCLDDGSIAAVIYEWHDRIVNVHIEDMRRGVHEHLMFGEGEIDFPLVIAVLKEVEYDGPLHVELSRHSHVGPASAQKAFDYLSPLLDLS
ncbi:sugar phosphate isomerase/epimerase family protein [Bythopirellula polymerisocia]|uniref:L-ribulose-5-phosphate 3-epimerase UlaE n=1 Tax=Bythopirellula polymerisocia TaxID=2528003 RepID=A0A5C6CTX8_9BACT|nr:sugar phosphate isomerase/epimerase family protein [Bythopirellula polymerisocia]TWU27315.1 L-ribulose-5-phosphate 3-epimerase UlaE [Bythopirellula polymerisocia]